MIIDAVKRGKAADTVIAGSKLSVLALLSLLAVAVLGCGGGGGGGDVAATDPGTGDVSTATDRFWAYDFDTPGFYRVSASLVGEGSRCKIYLEDGQAVPQVTIDAIRDRFDAVIYPSVRAAYGDEPDADGDPKIKLLLLDIRDGFDMSTSPSYVAGYFYSVDQFATPYSNEADIFYMDIDPAVPGSAEFFGTIAHEFQHMIHFNVKPHDDTWLDEAMSEVASQYCGFGPDYSRALTFEDAPGNSLTEWGGVIEDYAVVHHFATYLKDWYDGGAVPFFKRVLLASGKGTESVNRVLGADNGVEFAKVFMDWGVANYSGTSLSWPDDPLWSYRSMDLWPGRHDESGVVLSGLFAGRVNPASLAPLGAWSVGYYAFTGGGELTWTSGDRREGAVLGDNATVVELSSGVSSRYSGTGYLVVGNASDRTNASGSVTGSASVALPISIEAAMRSARESGSVAKIARLTGKPVRLCMQPALAEEGRRLLSAGVLPMRKGRGSVAPLLVQPGRVD